METDCETVDGVKLNQLAWLVAVAVGALVATTVINTWKLHDLDRRVLAIERVLP